MAKFWFAALALICAGLWASPAMANSADDNVGSIRSGGGQGAADTTLGEKGLVFQSDGFEVRVTTRVQIRMEYQNEVGNGESGANGADFWNFSIARAKTTFSGYIFEKEFQYTVRLAWTGGNLIEIAKFRWAAHQYINLSAGQDKLNWSWEQYTSSGRLSMVDRSYTDAVFNQNYAKGIWIDGQIGEETPFLKYMLGLYNGRLRAGNDFRNADQGFNGTTQRFSNLTDMDMMINLRIESHFLGAVEQSMNDMRGEDERDQILVAVGLGVNWFASPFNDDALRTDPSGAGTTGSGRFRTSQDTMAITFDAHFRWMGLSADFAIYYRKTDFHSNGSLSSRQAIRNKAGIADLTDFGWTFEVSYFIIAQELNVALRYSNVDADDFWQGGGTGFSVRPDATEIGVGVTYYVHGENLKITMDILWVGQQLGFNGSTGGVLGVYNNPPNRIARGGLRSGADHNDLWKVRFQLQYIF
jgi:hypothetical protein